MSGWIKLHRSLLDWEWYSDNNVFRVFTHILLKANFEDRNWQGQVIKRGSFVTSLQNLAVETSLTIQQVRTALTKLKSTHEITSQATSGYTLVTIIKYSDYQDDDSDSNTPNNTQDNNPATNEQQTDNKRITTTKELKNIRIKEEDNNISSLRSDIFTNTPVSEGEVKKPKKEYAFDGKVIHLTPDDYNRWEKAYPNLNLYAELINRDEYLATQPVDIQKKWFPSTAVYLGKRNQQANDSKTKTLGEQSSGESIWEVYDRLGIPYTKPEGVK